LDIREGDGIISLPFLTKKSGDVISSAQTGGSRSDWLLLLPSLYTLKKGHFEDGAEEIGLTFFFTKNAGQIKFPIHSCVHFSSVSGHVRIFYIKMLIQFSISIHIFLCELKNKILYISATISLQNISVLSSNIQKVEKGAKKLVQTDHTVHCTENQREVQDMASLIFF
jgi:hypothetical protein